MGSALRASVPSRRATGVLVVLGLILGASVGHAIELTSASASTASPVATAPERTFPAARTHVGSQPARVLFIGDSILDQQGNAAANLLRQSGVDAKALGLWGSGLLTVDQYDYGKTKLSGGWLRIAARQITAFDPDVVGVYMNHNYWPPYPHDAAGNTITDLWAPAGQRMIAQQVRALVTILRARGAQVFFVSPIPAGSIDNSDPSVWNPIWHGYLPALRAMHVPVADSAGPLQSASGLRAQTKPTCRGTQQNVRIPNDVHLTRFGAGRAGTVLAGYVAKLVHASLDGNAAPGDADAALVPTRSGRGYWIVGCDGSIYHFGDAAHLAGARGAIAGHGGVAAAVATSTGAGLWLVAADGTIASIGDARALAFDHPPDGPITGAAAMPDDTGVWATTKSGVVVTAGEAKSYGDLDRADLDPSVVDIVATRDGHGYWLVTNDGGVFGFGDAPFYGSESGASLTAPVVGLAATADDGGYWIVTGDGHVFAFGNAPFDGSGEWRPRQALLVLHTPAPGPTIGIASAHAARGYWVFGSTGRVSPRGAVGHFGGNNNLALHTQ